MKRPLCFGKFFNPDAAECVGGEEPGYEHPETESSTRDVCPFVNSCQQITGNLKGSKSLLRATK